MIEQITIDAYGGDELPWAFRQAFQDEASLLACRSRSANFGNYGGQEKSRAVPVRIRLRNSNLEHRELTSKRPDRRFYEFRIFGNNTRHSLSLRRPQGEFFAHGVPLRGARGEDLESKKIGPLKNPGPPQWGREEPGRGLAVLLLHRDGPCRPA